MLIRWYDKGFDFREKNLSVKIRNTSELICRLYSNKYSFCSTCSNYSSVYTGSC